LAQYGLVRSKSEAKRLFEEGAVEIDQRTALDWKSPWQFKKKTLIRVGKKRFLLVEVK
jgi:tyrosyl-tRNA synthetase